MIFHVLEFKSQVKLLKIIVNTKLFQLFLLLDLSAYRKVAPNVCKKTPTCSYFVMLLQGIGFAELHFVPVR